MYMLPNTTGVHNSLHLCAYFIHYYESYKLKTKHDSVITLDLAHKSTPIKRAYGTKWNVIELAIMYPCSIMPPVSSARSKGIKMNPTCEPPRYFYCTNLWGHCVLLTGNPRSAHSFQMIYITPLCC